MTSDNHTYVQLRELAQRANAGIEVRLLWDERNDSIVVSVVDVRVGERLLLDVPRDRALDAFHHPFHYAACGHAAATPLAVAA